MKPIIINEQEVNTEALIAGFSAIIGGTTYLIVRKVSEKHAVPALLISQALAPVVLIGIVKMISKQQNK